MANKYTNYNQKCKFFNFRLRKEKDQKYIEFLENCTNKAEFIRQAIDDALGEPVRPA